MPVSARMSETSLAVVTEKEARFAVRPGRFSVWLIEGRYLGNNLRKINKSFNDSARKRIIGYIQVKWS
jgi:hypothetical protein